MSLELSEKNMMSNVKISSLSDSVNSPGIVVKLYMSIALIAALLIRFRFFLILLLGCTGGLGRAGADGCCLVAAVVVSAGQEVSHNLKSSVGRLKLMHKFAGSTREPRSTLLLQIKQSLRSAYCSSSSAAEVYPKDG